MNFKDLRNCIIDANLAKADLLTIREYGSVNTFNISEFAFKSIKYIQESSFKKLTLLVQ
tara:strand:+ start:46948 stop:47124 length:177 start_codon:yes stop_codon:yes gene_type:complete